MAEWDPQTGKLKPTWTVRFSVWWTYVGCAIAGVVTAVVLFLSLVTGPGLSALNDDTRSIAQGGVLILGLSLGVFLVIGPTLAWGLGFALRTYTNQTIHILAFASLGLIVGFMLGNLVGIGGLVAPAAGIGAAVGRWAIQGQTKI